MKVLLINPPVRDFYNTPLRRYPLGLLYLAAALRERGHDVSLIDSGASSKRRVLEPPPELAGGDRGKPAADSSPFALFGPFRHHGPSFEEIAAKTAAFRPDVVGVSSLFSPYAREAEEAAAAARRAAPGAVVILGGGHPSALPEAALAHPAVDYVVVGEGERALPDLLEALEKGKFPRDGDQPRPGGGPKAPLPEFPRDGDQPSGRIPGIAFIREGRLHLTPPRFAGDPDSFPLPARDLADREAYIRRGGPFTQILSSRGCPRGCAFCSAHLTAGRTFRSRRPERVVEEMKICVEKYGIEHFDFEDDNLTLDRPRALGLLRLIARTFGRRRLFLEALNGISLEGLDGEILDALADAGFRTLHLAPLAKKEETLAAMGRREGPVSFIEAARLAAARGMEVTGYVMIGFPGQGLREIMDLVDLLAREKVRIRPSVFYPAAGSRIQKEILPRLDGACSAAWAATRSSCFPLVPGGLSRKALKTAFWMTRLADFAAALTGDGASGRLEALLEKTTAARAMGAPHPRGRPWIVRSPRGLKPRERGLEALGAYARTGIPHGIKLLERGRGGRMWRYEVFALPGLIEDKSFYRRYGVPGLGLLFPDRP